MVTVRLQSAEAVSVAETVRATYPGFRERPDWPTETAAAFLRYDPPTGETHFYLLPGFVRAEPFMVQRYLAKGPSAKSVSRRWLDSPWIFSTISPEL